MTKSGWYIGCLLAVMSVFSACKNDVANTGMSVLDEDDEIIALLRSEIRNLPLIDAEQVFFTVNWR